MHDKQTRRVLADKFGFRFGQMDNALVWLRPLLHSNHHGRFKLYGAAESFGAVTGSVLPLH